jgi:hypothetical protein
MHASPWAISAMIGLPFRMILAIVGLGFASPQYARGLTQ